MSKPKGLALIRKSDETHWVGDGFPVRTMFGYHDSRFDMSPFLLLDYAGPAEFPPTKERLGVEEHPHRGFETVTIVYSGEVEHRDSSGGGGKIGPGDVQWMTAASGVVHEEFHGVDFAKNGGVFQMVQLWVNLPKKDKMTSPRYQTLTKSQIKNVDLKNGAGVVRVIAGEFAGVKGPAHTFSPVNLWDIRLNKNATVDLKLPEGHTTAILNLNGKVALSDGEKINEAELAVFNRTGEVITLKTEEPAMLLLLAGEPINEPVVGSGPFVMNSMEEIERAYSDYHQGRMGKIAPQST
ncbi:MAG: quercetin 2,3-dioxygenase [Bacteriovoracaceae bacterium]|nr:quercetin 2,3-dioxygenase [Bacteriovoracaceae bacterium]